MKQTVIHIDADALVGSLARNWWTLLLRGVLAIAFALLTWFQPGISIAAMVLVFGAYALVEGLFGIWGALATRGGPRLPLLLWSLVSIAIGVVTFAMPAVTALALLYLIAAWACLTGIFEIAAAIHLRKVIANEWWLILAGVLSLLFGIALIVSPVSGALVVAWLIATYAFVLGLFLVLVSLRLRKLRP